MSVSLAYVGTAGIVYIVVFGVIVPVIALRGARRLRTQPLPAARAVFRSVLVQQAFIFVASLAVSRAEWIPLYIVPDRWFIALSLAVVVTVGLVLVMRPMWRRAVARGDARIQLLSPRTAGERAMWIAVSIAAGVAEEVAYRGVLWVLLERLLGAPMVAALVASIAFGVAHALQGWRSAVVITAVALGMHGLVRATGSLLAPILVHVAYDVIAGFTYAALQRHRPVPSPDWPSPA